MTLDDVAALITSPHNETLKLVRKLASRRWRDKLGLFVAEGEDLVDAARAEGIEPVELLVAGENVEPALLAEVSTLGHPPRVIGIFRHADLASGLQPQSQPTVALALWRVADPGNVGTLIRTADALGPAAVLLSPGCADPTGPKALRASVGSIFRVPFVPGSDPVTWLERNCVALVARGGTPLAELELAEPVTFVLGAEREGLPDELVAACAATATIPQQTGAESLNVAVAGAIALYELRRGR